MEIKKQIALDNNNVASFKKKWASFKYCPSEEQLIRFFLQKVNKAGVDAESRGKDTQRVMLLFCLRPVCLCNVRTFFFSFVFCFELVLTCYL